MVPACNQTFEPDGAYDQRLVVYGILSMTSDTQYVRIMSTYQTSPINEQVRAVVDVAGLAGNVHFNDTTVVRPDDLGTPTSYFVYAANGFKPQPGWTYVINISTPLHGTARGSTLGLKSPDFYVKNPADVTNPGRTEWIDASASFNSVRGAFVLRFVVEFQVLVGASWVTGYIEIPKGAVFDASGNHIFEYPTFGRVPIASLNLDYTTTEIRFSTEQYLAARERIASQNPGLPVQFTRALFTLTQIDDALYNYFYILNGPKDLGTTRLDIPDYTNISGGLGVFGCRYEVRHEILLNP